MNLRAFMLLPLLGLAAAQSTTFQTSAAQTTATQTTATQTTATQTTATQTTTPQTAPATPAPATPAHGTPAPTTPAPAAPVTAPPARLENVSAVLSAPRSVKGKLPLTLTLRSARAAFKLEIPRDNEQNCVTAPTVRVLRVGTREVVYPRPGQAPRLCAQDLRSDTVSAQGQVNYARDLDLPAGEYMVEGWLTGFADGLRVKVPAQPLRVTVK